MAPGSPGAISAKPAGKGAAVAAGRVLVPRPAFAAPDTELMHHILDGLPKMD